MKYYAAYTESESLMSIKIFDNEQAACAHARMLWDHLTDSEKEEKRIRVYLVDVPADVENDIEYYASDKINDGAYDEIVWDCWSYEHALIAFDIADEIEKYMEKKEVAVHISGTEIEAFTTNWIVHELEEMDDNCGELTTRADKDWFLGILKNAVDERAEAGGHDRFADRYVLTYIGKDEDEEVE